MRTRDNPKKGKTTNNLQKLMKLNAVKNQGYENVMDSLKFAGISPLNPYAEGVYHYKNDTILWNAYKEGMKKAKQDYFMDTINIKSKGGTLSSRKTRNSAKLRPRERTKSAIKK